MLRAIAFGLVGLVVIESRFLFVCDVTTVTAPTRPSCCTFRPRTDWREAGMSGVISEGGERPRVFLDGKTRATKRGPKIAPRDVVTAAAQAFARNEIDRAELMRRITPSLKPVKSQASFLFAM